MEPTRETDTGKDPFEELLEFCQTLTEPPTPTQEELEEKIREEARYEDWDEVLGLLKQLSGPISRAAARECLICAVRSAPPEVFADLLDHLPREEYAGKDTYYVKWSPTGEVYRRHYWEVSVQGTLVVHAAAANKPKHLAALLERGQDANSASPAATTALLNDCGEDVVRYQTGGPPFHPFTARPESRLCLRRWDADPDDIPPLDMEGATPLAAALLFGHGECARLLVEYGAWLQESPGVSQAMWLAWREKEEAYQAARSHVFARDGAAAHRPVLWALGRTCSPRQLKQVLETWTYSREELSCAARRMLVDFEYQDTLWKEPEQGWKDLCHRLWLLGRVCPEALCAPEVFGELLGRCLEANERTLEPFLPLLEGKTLDLSQMHGACYWMREEKGKALMETLASRCTCVMDRDGVSQRMRTPELRLLLKCVTFLPPALDRGVSNLTVAILQTGDLRLIRRALEREIIPPEETTEELLCCQRQLSLPPVCRTLLLTLPRPGKPRPPQDRGLIEGAPRWFAESVPGEVTPLLEEANWKRWFYPLLQKQTGLCRIKAAEETWQTRSIFTALCMLGRTEAVEHWLRYLPEEPWNSSTFFSKDRQLHAEMTPLGAAALAGRTEIVRLLLDNGAPAAEHLCGTPCAFTLHWSEEGEIRLPCTALLAALIGYHWDTARLLLDHGALCDPREPGVLKLWRQFHEEDLQSTVALHLGMYLSGEGVLGRENAWRGESDVFHKY